MVITLYQDSGKLTPQVVNSAEHSVLNSLSISTLPWNEPLEYMSASGRYSEKSEAVAGTGSLMRILLRDIESHYYVDCSQWGIDVEELHGMENYPIMSTDTLLEYARIKADDLLGDFNQPQLVLHDFQKKACVCLVGSFTVHDELGFEHRISCKDNELLFLARFFHQDDVMMAVPSHCLITSDNYILPRGIQITEIPVIVSENDVHEFLNLDMSLQDRFALVGSTCEAAPFEIVQLPQAGSPEFFTPELLDAQEQNPVKCNLKRK